MEFMGLRGIRPPQAMTVGDVGSYGISNGAYGPTGLVKGRAGLILASPRPAGHSSRVWGTVHRERASLSVVETYSGSTN
jgi:hypothetical protein